MEPEERPCYENMELLLNKTKPEVNLETLVAWTDLEDFLKSPCQIMIYDETAASW